MPRLLPVWLASCVVISVAASGFAAEGDKRPDTRPDPRLDQPISISTAYDSLEEFLPKLAALTAAGPAGAAGHPVAITVDPVIRDHKVVVRVKEQPLREVMRQVAVLFDFTWAQQDGAQPSYRLTQSEERAALGPALAERYFAETDARDVELFKHACRAAAAAAQERRKLARSDPEAVALVALQPIAWAALATLDEAGVVALLGGEQVRVPVKGMSAEAQAKLKEAVLKEYEERGEPQREEDWRWEDAELCYRMLMESRPWHTREWMEIPPAAGGEKEAVSAQCLGFHLWVAWPNLAQALDEMGKGSGERQFDAATYEAARSLERDYGIDLAEQAESAGASALPEWARLERLPELPAESGKLVPLSEGERDAVGMPRFQPSVLPELLLRVAERLDINLVADCYWTKGLRTGLGRRARDYPAMDWSQGTCSVDANADYTLGRICRSRLLSLAKDGGIYRVRHRAWFANDAEEAPASVLNEWMRRTDHEKHVSLDDYLYLATHLTEAQAGNLGGTAYRGRYYREATGPVEEYESLRVLRYAWMLAGFGCQPAVRLYALLTPELREKAETTGLLVNSELPADLRPLVRGIAEVQRRVGNHPFGAMSPPEIEELLAETRLWAGMRVSFAENGAPGAAGYRPQASLCIELWKDGQPDWNDSSKDEGLLHTCAWLALVTEDETTGAQAAE